MSKTMIKIKEHKLYMDKGFHRAYRLYRGGSFKEAEEQMCSHLGLKLRPGKWVMPVSQDMKEALNSIN